MVTRVPWRPRWKCARNGVAEEPGRDVAHATDCSVFWEEDAGLRGRSYNTVPCRTRYR